MQDCVVWLGMKGFDLDDVLDIDVLSFNELTESVQRLDNIESADRVYGHLMAAQCEAKAVVKWIKERYLRETGTSEPKPVTTGAFMSKFAGGL